MNGMLSPLNGKIPSYETFAFDIETTGKSNDFLMGSIVGKDFKRVFWNKKDMIDCFMNERRFYYRSRIFSTNLYFDIMALFQDDDLISRMSIISRGSKFLQVKIKSDVNKRKLTFLDTLNYCQLSVAELGKIVGLPKLETPSYIKEERLPREEEHLYIEEYNIRDSEISFRFASFLQDAFRRYGCRMRMTAASTAMDLFRRKYLDRNLFQEPIPVMGRIFESYYGGRVEVFKRGTVRNCNYYDFNSLYPSVMRNAYPEVSSSRYREKGSLHIIEEEEGISEVIITSPPNLRIPLLPYRSGEKLIFPVGTFRGHYTHVELRRALSLGYVIEHIGEQIYYTRTHSPFKAYVETLYSERKELKSRGDNTELVIKLMMNSLYGKFGQRITGKESVYPADSLTLKDIDRLTAKGKFRIEGRFAFLVEENPSHVARHILPIYSVYTTAYGRLKLYEAIKDIDVIYVDTDSIITPEVLPQSSELGDLKLECQIKEGIFIRPKMYAYITPEGRSKVKIKGNPAAYHWDYAQFKAFLESPRVKCQRFSTFKMSNKKNIPFNSIVDMEKEFSLDDDKRNWNQPFDPYSLEASAPLTAEPSKKRSNPTANCSSV